MMFARIFGRGAKGRLRCAVVTPIGPGHSGDYRECASSVKTAWRRHRGPFSALELVSIDDSAGTLGRSRARNQGVKRAAAASADWIFFLDADDLMLPDAFANVADLVETYDAVWGLIASRALGASDHHLRLPQILSIDELGPLLVFDPFLTLQMGHFVRTAAALATPFDDNLNAGEDFDYYLRLWRRYRCVKVPRPLFVARQGRHSQGPRSASAEDWGSAVRARLARERVAHGLHADSPESLAIKNAAITALQTFYRERGFADATNYLALAHDMPYRGSHRIEVCGAKPFEMYSDNDDVACLSLAWTGEYRETSSRLWHALSGTARFILDLGAHTGFYGLLAASAARAETQIYCFEPSTDHYERLRMNIGMNGNTNITAFRTAIGPQPIEANIAAHPSQHAACVEPLDMVSVTDVVRDRAGPVDLVRIDAEGSAMEVILEIMPVIAADHPDIFLEVAPGELTRKFGDLLAAAGYRSFVIDEDGGRLVPLARDAGGDGHGSRTCWMTARGDADVRSLIERSGNELILA